MKNSGIEPAINIDGSLPNKPKLETAISKKILLAENRTKSGAVLSKIDNIRR
jgi:hypothetical protein